MLRAAILSAYLFFPGISAFAQKDSGKQTPVKQWFRAVDFDIASFKKPLQKFGPFTRWWWPGNDVTNKELQREIVLFAANGFAGVEVQPFSSGLNPKGLAEQLKRQLSWDTPSFYAHLRIVMEQAKKSGIVVDLNAGSGWPMGGPQITPDSSLLTLAYADTLIEGGKYISFPIPQLKQEKFTVRPGGFQFNQTVAVSYAKLQAVIAARFLRKENNQIFLDLITKQDITKMVAGNHISWQAPEGDWKILVFYSIPDGELPKAIASDPKGFVVDHLDSNILFANYHHLLGERTGLRPYFGKPLRAVFNDSYEFMPDRHYANNFLSFFKQQRGYDIAPYLPVNMKKFYNNAYITPFTGHQPFDFFYSDEDWRLRYDYDVTVSDLMKTEFIKSSNGWLNNRNLLHRTQAYGARMDVIGASGEADIPETEQLAGDNSEAFLKLVTSGAHLYNKPIISQESFVFRGLAETTTPQKIRLLADKSFSAGVNQIIYHGTPYKYQTGEYGKEGWSPFSSPFSPNDNFSSTINESYPFWGDVKSINKYISRCQYILQSGKPRADVLIYFPFNDFIPEQLTPNPKEIMVGGQFKGVEPVIASDVPAVPQHDDKTKKWFADLWPLINKLEAQGATWDFVNDASLQDASGDGNGIVIRGNSYTTIVIANAPYMALLTAVKITELAKHNADILFYGDAPAMQPSYLNFKENDEKTSQLIQIAFSQSNTKRVKDETGIDEWINGLPLKLKFTKPYDFTRTSERQSRDGSLIKFIWNQTDQEQTVSILADTGYKSFYWLNAETGAVIKNKRDAITYHLQPYSTIFLMATDHLLPDRILSPLPVINQLAKDVVRLERWNIKMKDTVFKEASLFDWRTQDALKYKSDKALYTTNFKLNKKETGKQYLLDLGVVYFTAEVMVNGKPAGKRIWAPYQLNIASLLKQGENKIEILITPTYRNEFIGEAVKGNSKYVQFKKKEQTSMPAGLIGPVVLKQLDL